MPPIARSPLIAGHRSSGEMSYGRAQPDRSAFSAKPQALSNAQILLCLTMFSIYNVNTSHGRPGPTKINNEI